MPWFKRSVKLVTTPYYCEHDDGLVACKVKEHHYYVHSMINTREFKRYQKPCDLLKLYLISRIV